MDFSKYLSFRTIITYSGLNYLQSGLSFLTSVLLARELGQFAYGYFVYGLVISNSLAVLIQFGTDKTLVRDLVQQPNAEKLLFAASWIKLGFALISIVGILIWLFGFAGFSSAKNSVIILCTIAGCLLGFSPKSWFDLKGKIQYHALILLVDRTIFFVGSLFFLYVYRTELVIVHIAGCLLLGRLIMSWMEWHFIQHTTTVERLFDIAAPLRFLFKHNLWVWLAAIGNLMMTNANQFLVDWKLGTAELGLFGLAMQLMVLVRLLQNQILRLASPSIAQIVQHKKANIILRQFIKNCLLSLGLTLGVLIPFYWFGPLFIRFTVGSAFIDAVPIFNILCLWMLIYGIALINNQYLLSFHLQRPYFLTTILFGLLSLYLAYLFIGWYGVTGAAWSLLIAHSGSVIVQLLLVIHRIKQV